MFMPPKERTILEPEGSFTRAGGWKEQTYYVVDVAFKASNPVHRRILYVGFLNGAKGRPLSGGYTCLLRADGDDQDDPEKLHYLKPICEIPEMNRKS